MYTVVARSHGYCREVCVGTKYLSVMYHSNTLMVFGITSCIGNSASKVNSKIAHKHKIQSVSSINYINSSFCVHDATMSRNTWVAHFSALYNETPGEK